MSGAVEATAPFEAPASESFGKVALVHDYLNQWGGAERVALELSRMWPKATMYTSIYRPESTFPEFREHRIRTSMLQVLPVDHRFRDLLPLYPAAMRSLGTIDADLVVSSSSAWAHGVRVRGGAFHAVYCHTPARWLYGGDYFGASSGRQKVAAPLMAWLRRWDWAAARRADLYMVNSAGVRERVRAAYGIDSVVVHPPVDTDRFQPTERGDRLLVVSRLLPYKRIDVVVEAATRAGLPLDVVGTGPYLDQLRALAGPSVTFHGRLADADVTELMQGCRAFCLPGREDFGITAVEAQAAGKPVVAFGAGGALETVKTGESGAFFFEHRPEAVLDAVRAADALQTAPEELARRASRFSRHAFRERVLDVLSSARAGS